MEVARGVGRNKHGAHVRRNLVASPGDPEADRACTSHGVGNVSSCVEWTFSDHFDDHQCGVAHTVVTKRLHWWKR